MSSLKQGLKELQHAAHVEENEIHGVENILRALLDVTLENNHLLRKLLAERPRPGHRPVHLTLTLASKGNPMFTGQQLVATVTEADAAGINFPIDASKISFRVAPEDQGVILITDNLDGTATVIAVGPGTGTLTAIDSQFKLTGSVTITVEDAPPPADTPTTLTITLGDPTTPTTTNAAKAK